MPTRISIIAGEASGDLMGGRLAQCLRSIEPDVVLAGIGGERMRDAGVRLWDDPTRLSAVGLVEVLMKLRSYKRLFDATLKALVDMRPDLVVLIDYPGFNLRLGDRLKALGIPCVYYIPPTAWAWGAKRAERVAGFAQKVLSVFPFEVDVYAKAGANVQFVGHPLVDSLDPFSVSERLQFEPGTVKVLGLFPGSRNQEIDKLLPVMLESCKIIQKARPDVIFELSLAPTVDEQRVLKYVSASGVDVRLDTGSCPQLMSRCFAGVVASGTATLEAALVGMPMVIVYRVSPLTMAIARRLLTISSIGLPNIVLGRRAVPELVQEDCTPDRVADEMLRFCSDPEYYGRVIEDLSLVRERLGEPGASLRAAQAVLEVARSCAAAGGDRVEA
ncbi:MAG: lipid-A-disaccharide synthase [Firmicutes bacterium]|nr:lipid-A-disaccharide synthase [Bacillota bacterium]